MRKDELETFNSYVAEFRMIVDERVWKPATPLVLDEVSAESDAVLDDSIGGAAASTVGARTGGAGTQTLATPVVETRSSRHLTWGAIAPYAIIIVVFSLSQIPFVKAWLTADCVNESATAARLRLRSR